MMFHTRLFIDLLTTPTLTTTSTTRFLNWLENKRVTMLASTFPTIKDFYRQVRTLVLFCACSRWSCPHEDIHGHGQQGLCENDSMHAGHGLEVHLDRYEQMADRVSELARQLCVCPTVSMQFEDTWLLPSHDSLPDENDTEVNERDEESSNDEDDWLSRQSVIVGGNIDQDISDNKLTAEEEDEHNTAFAFGVSMESKMRGILEVATRLSFWTNTHLRIMRERQCIALRSSELSRGVFRLRAMFSDVLRIEPDDSVRVLFTTLVYQNAMTACTREFYLQRNPRQSVRMNMITIMNNSLSPEHIKWIQSSFNGKKMTEIVIDNIHPYKDLVDLCLFGSQFEVQTKQTWLKRYCAFGNSFQDMVPVMFSATRDNRPRRPLVVLVAGQWCVLERIDTVFLCKTSIEAVLVWLLLIWTRYDCTLEDGLKIHSFVRRCFDSVVHDTHGSTDIYFSEASSQRWAARLGGSSFVWTSDTI
jgi:hypothetical protein